LDVVVEQDEAGYFVAEVSALPGCLSQGKTSEEAVTNVKEAIEKDGLKSWNLNSLLIPPGLLKLLNNASSYHLLSQTKKAGSPLMATRLSQNLYIMS